MFVYCLAKYPKFRAYASQHGFTRINIGFDRKKKPNLITLTKAVSLSFFIKRRVPSLHVCLGTGKCNFRFENPALEIIRILIDMATLLISQSRLTCEWQSEVTNFWWIKNSDKIQSRSSCRFKSQRLHLA